MAPNDNPWGGSAATNKPGRLGGSTPKLSERVSEKFGQTKDVASAGFEKTKVVAAVGYEKTKVVAAVGYDKSKVAAKKVKEGASVGVNWIKLKYKHFQKK